jgi:hypothetical protein
MWGVGRSPHPHKLSSFLLAVIFSENSFKIFFTDEVVFLDFMK